MDTKKYLDLVGLKHYDSKIKTFIANSITNAEATYTDSFVKKDENGAIINPWQIITDETLLSQAPTSKAVLDYVGTFAKSVQGEIESIKTSIAGGVHFIGVMDEKPQTANNGDIVIVGDKEFIWSAPEVGVVGSGEWIELGDTTAELQRITTLEGRVGVKQGEEGVTASTGIYALIEELEEGIRQDFSTADEAIMDGIGKFSTEDEDGTGLCLEIEERDAATLGAAKKYADDKVKDITDGNYVKSFGGKTGDITLSAEGNVTLEMVDNALKASYDDTNADGISWKETQAITEAEIDALFA